VTTRSWTAWGSGSLGDRTAHAAIAPTLTKSQLRHRASDVTMDEVSDLYISISKSKSIHIYIYIHV